MFQIFIILFREVLEIALILGIINASTSHIQDRKFYITIGLLVGVVVSLIIALSTKYVADYYYTQDLTNAILLLISSCMMIWTIVWMGQHSRSITESVKGYSEKSLSSNLPLISLSILTASLVLREGIEIVLFSYGIFSSSHEPLLYLCFAGLCGMLSAIVIGVLVQLGILVIPIKYLFKVTSVILSLVAAGMASQAANFLVTGGIIKDYGGPLWNSSTFISQASILGKILNILIGYTSNPTLVEILFYLATLVSIIVLLKFSRARESS